jgi:hypothetical protein
MHVDDVAERAQRQVGRPSTVTNFRKPILEILQHAPDLASLSLSISFPASARSTIVLRTIAEIGKDRAGSGMDTSLHS